MTPPVTMLAVPIVSSTNPQKIPACMIAAPGVLEHLGLDEGVLDQADDAGRDVRERVGRARHREDPQVPGHREEEERRRAPEDDEDERVGRDVGERCEHRALASLWRVPVIVRSGEGLEGVVEHRHERLEQFECALRAAGQVDDEAPAAHADDAA